MKSSIGTTPDPEFDVQFNQAVAAKQAKQKQIAQGQEDSQVQSEHQAESGSAANTANKPSAEQLGADDVKY